VNRGETIVVHSANALVGITGVVYAVMRYLMEPADEWAVVNHPWQPHVQHLHVLAAPLLVFAVGFIWSRHVAAKMNQRAEGRRTGLGLLVAFVPMAASGYLIQVAVEPSWRSAWIGLHLASSALWIVAFAIHRIRHRTAARRSDRRSRGPVFQEPG
jgi:hypothetical protein